MNLKHTCTDFFDNHGVALLREMTKEKAVTMDMIENAWNIYQQSKGGKTDGHHSAGDAAMMATGGGKCSKCGRGAHAAGTKCKVKDDQTCNNCGGVGHFAKACSKPKAADDPKKKK